jgi:hypothetical protein
VLSANVLFATATVLAPTRIAPPPKPPELVALLPVNVLLATVPWPEKRLRYRAPPPATAVLLINVLPVTTAVSRAQIAPPSASEVFPRKVVLATVSGP